MPALVMPLISLDSGMVLETMEKFAWSYGGCRKNENSFAITAKNQPFKTFYFSKTPDAKQIAKKINDFQVVIFPLIFSFSEKSELMKLCPIVLLLNRLGEMERTKVLPIFMNLHSSLLEKQLKISRKRADELVQEMRCVLQRLRIYHKTFDIDCGRMKHERAAEIYKILERVV